MDENNIISNNNSIHHEIINIYCNDHPNEEAIFFCNTCETECLCVNCIVEGLHKDHDVFNVMKGFYLLKDKFKKI